MKTSSLIKLLSVILLAGVTNYSNAQIKVVGNDYSHNLTGAKKYYDRDINFDRLFPRATSVERTCFRPYPTQIDGEINMLGDTIYVWRNLSKEEGRNKELFLTNKSIVKSGYYVITGYVFCKENWDSIRAIYGFDNYVFGFYAPDRTIHHLKEDILRSDFNNLNRYLAFIILTSTEETDGAQTKVFLGAQKLPKCYAYNGYREAESYGASNFTDFVYLRYYNGIKNHFLGKEVYWVHEGHRMMIDKCDYSRWGVMEEGFCDSRNSEAGIIYDDLKKEKIKLLDKKYMVTDVILNSEGKICCVLEGAQTGSFAVEIPMISYAYTSDNIRGISLSTYCDFSSSPVGDIPFLITHNQVDNYVYLSLVTTSDYDIAKRRKTNKQKAQKRKEIEEKQATKEALVAKYGSQFGELVAKKQVSIGMSKEMCREAWGIPVNTYRTTTSFGQSEVWCYNYKTRVYFYNGKVVQIDD